MLDFEDMFKLNVLLLFYILNFIQSSFHLRRKDYKKYRQRISNCKRLILVSFSCPQYTTLSLTTKMSCSCDKEAQEWKKYKQLMNNAYVHSSGQIILFPSGYHFSSLSRTLQSWMLIAPTNVFLLFTINIKTCPWSSVTSSYTT